MKTLLLRPFTDASQGNSPPLSLMYLSSYLKSKLCDVKIIDNCVYGRLLGNLNADNVYIKNMMQDISDYNPDIIGMTLFSRELEEIAALCKLIKNEFKSKLIVLGGPHPTAMPDESLQQIPECDFIIRGEGEIVLYDLITGLSSNSDLGKIKGVSFQANGKVFHGEDADIIRDLEDLPFPDREGLIHNYRNGKYGHVAYGMPSDIIMTSRGCPFQCKFCFKVCSKYRSRSAGNVMKEIDWIINNIGPEYIQIMDDSFTVQRKRCTEILEALIEKSYPCKFKVRSRVNAVDEELLKTMKKAGVTTIVYGFESGSQAMLNAFDKRTTVEQNIRACKLAKKAGLNCFGDMLLFYPGETKETIKETETFIKSARPHAVKFYVLSPLPRTKIYEEAKQNNSLIGDWRIGEKSPWIKLDDFKDVEKMEQIAKSLFLKQFLNPWRFFWFIKSQGRSFLKSPIFFVKMFFNTFLARVKY